jgi:predicted Fe-S protein YdhL (DUF1289 family)
MPMFPKIDSPCPYKSRLASVMDGDMCRMCNRQVFDLSAMSDGERAAFLAGCREEVCVSYRFPIRPAIAAAALAAAVGLPAAAAAAGPEDENVQIIVGGIKDPAHAQMVEQAGDASMPVLPVVYEPARKAQAAKPAPKAGARRLSARGPSAPR